MDYAAVLPAKRSPEQAARESRTTTGQAMGDYTLAAGIFGFCVLLAGYEIVLANRTRKGGANATDWKRARGIVGIGLLMGGLAWLVGRIIS